MHWVEIRVMVYVRLKPSSQTSSGYSSALSDYSTKELGGRDRYRASSYDPYSSNKNSVPWRSKQSDLSSYKASTPQASSMSYKSGYGGSSSGYGSSSKTSMSHSYHQDYSRGTGLTSGISSNNYKRDQNHVELVYFFSSAFKQHSNRCSSSQDVYQHLQPSSGGLPRRSTSYGSGLSYGLSDSSSASNARNYSSISTARAGVTSSYNPTGYSPSSASATDRFQYRSKTPTSTFSTAVSRDRDYKSMSRFGDSDVTSKKREDSVEKTFEQLYKRYVVQTSPTSTSAPVAAARAILGVTSRSANNSSGSSSSSEQNSRE
uniref:Uncharacterized protein n=1 Tax=Ditylenchus dipsaci TaxID=166011 RepID=A0A915DI09_9BILA